ncbi:glycosyltransferase [Methyloversatilis sp. XJ19-49]|uniref:glycosyltransferase n=1 Tax=Methyloversatilis sp. XJ19-49 TaxID=2963429 RepID=UPI00211D0F30|nr:glycosyltransferase [Methyloversatilis sp. XJ19-49]MCQ9377370.1 glycosyltransferase [Methyloversatilis sp. XJ19-49]
MTQALPHLVVFSTLFPNGAQPQAGVFIRERMFRVGRQLPLTVVAPVPWFPLQSLLRYLRPHFRPDVPAVEVQQGVTVLHPRFLSVPGLFKRLDGLFMALGAYRALGRLQKQGRLDVLDAHFGYPDGYAASLLARWLDCPFTITLRGTETRHARTSGLSSRLRQALDRADRVFSVSASLIEIAAGLGVDRAKLQVVGNGVDTGKFFPIDKASARRELSIPDDAKVLISVGGLTERKGFHRVIEQLPALRREFPGLLYLIVGGASAEGDWGPRLKAQVADLGLAECVRFLGTLPPEALKQPLSAADVFVLATRNEGWANVFLEAMACRLPVVATDVGGNREVVCRDDLGAIVPFDDGPALQEALRQALARDWDRDRILAYAKENEWDGRVATLVAAFRELFADRNARGTQGDIGVG